MKDRNKRLIGAFVAAVTIIMLIVFQNNSVSDDFFEAFMLGEISSVERVYVYNDFDGIPATGTYVYKYELEEKRIDTSDWKELPFDIDYIYDCLDKADIEIDNAYYTYNEYDNKEDNEFYFDVAILDIDTNTLYHILHKTE